MSLEGRISKLEETIAKTHIDPKVDAELREWFKAHPGYRLLSQPKDPNEGGMPKYLLDALICRTKALLAERNLEPFASNLPEIFDALQRHYPHWSGG
jgi:hypothetical protein